MTCRRTSVHPQVRTRIEPCRFSSTPSSTFFFLSAYSPRTDVGHDIVISTRVTSAGRGPSRILRHGPSRDESRRRRGVCASRTRSRQHRRRRPSGGGALSVRRRPLRAVHVFGFIFFRPSSFDFEQQTGVDDRSALYASVFHAFVRRV